MSENNPKPKVPDQTPKDKPVLDEEVEEELEENFPEDPFLTEYAMGGSGGGESEKVDVTAEWIGDKEEWQAKTKLSAEQIIAMTQVRMMGDVFPELEGIKDNLDNMVENMEKYAVSHGGMAREQHVSVLRAMHSGEMHDDSGERSALMSMFSANLQQEDE